ncbi:MAG: uroporphyrinogen decarboxylase, partial [Chlamydiia bacterium]|nr:uroporphyrinogen decarboxylase [Chlamydiia bacterium]
HDTETVVETTILPVDLLGVDGAILFTDILTLLEGLSIRYDFQEGIGPVILDPPSAIHIRPPEEVYGYLTQAIYLLKKELKVPLLGFAGAPFTIASYCIEGKSSHDLKKTKEWMYRDPRGFHQLLETITEATIAYLHIQIDAGVQAIQLFDSWANALPYEEFLLYSLAPLKRITEAIKTRGIPIILFGRGRSLFVEELASLSPAAISLDWSGDLPSLRCKIPSSIAVQGNLDPMALYSPRPLLQERVERLLKRMEGDPGYIFNLGHGLLPDTPIENVHFLVDYVHNRSRAPCAL